jgi:hypothetical protein
MLILTHLSSTIPEPKFSPINCQLFYSSQFPSYISITLNPLRWSLQSLAVLSIYGVEGDIAVQCPSRLELAIYPKMIVKLEHLKNYQTSMIYINSVAFISNVQILDNFEGLEVILQFSFRPDTQN